MRPIIFLLNLNFGNETPKKVFCFFRRPTSLTAFAKFLASALDGFDLSTAHELSSREKNLNRAGTQTRGR